MSLDTELPPHPRYRLLALIGKGGMGEVFRTQDRLTGQMVALKRVRLRWPAAQVSPAVAEGGKTSLEIAATVDPGVRVPPRPLAAIGGLETAIGLAPSARLPEPERQRKPVQFGPTLAMQATHPGEMRALQGDAARVEPEPDLEFQALRLHLAQEFRTLAGLRHPHIVSVLDYGFDRSWQPYFTMELLEGAKTLDEAARSQPLAARIGLLLQVLQALTYLHRRNVLHRDLKPGNILVVSEQRGPKAKLLDFGLALVPQGPDPLRMEIAGTIGYIAPEVLLGVQATEVSDLFAVGVMAHELLLGAHPLGVLPTTAMVRGFIEPVPIFTEDTRISPALSVVLRRALARSPGERYPDAAAFAYDLARAADLPPPTETFDIRESFLRSARFQSRDTEMATLLSALQQARQGRGKVMLICGESGVGKSRLLDEFRAQALVRGARVLSGQAVHEGSTAFLVFRDVLAPLCLEQPLDDLASGVLLPLIPRLPALLERAIVPAPDVDAKSTQERVLSVIEQVIMSAASTPLHPLVVLLEDIQWAGSEVLLLLERLSEMCQNRPLLVLGSYRDEERPQLAATIPNAEVLKLRRFDRESVAAMAAAVLGPIGERRDLVDRLYQETEGNAFFIVEVMRALADAAGELTAVGTQTLPAHVFAGGVRHVIESRLGRVPAWARPMLERAAVAGRQLDLLVQVNSGPSGGYSSVTLEAWLAACADLAILEVVDQTWRFSHDKLRECLLERIAERGELPQVHREVAVAIERSYGEAERDPHAAVLAYHYAQAGEAGQAARYGLRAGERALKGGALDEAVEQFQATLRYQATSLTPLLDGVRARRMLSAAQYALGRLENCVSTVLDLHAFVGHALPTHGGGRAGVVLRALTVRAAQYFSSAIRLTPELSRPVVRELELTTIQSGVAFSFNGRVADAFILALLQNVLSNQVDSDDSRLLYEALFNMAKSLLPLGPLHRRGPAALPRSAPTFPEAYNFNLLLGCTINVGQGYWEHANRAAAVGMDIVRATGDSYLQMNFGSPMLLAAQYSGDFDLARARATELLALATKNKNALFAHWSLLCLAYLDLVDAKPAVALDRLRTLHAAAMSIGDALGLLAGMGLQARACLMAGDKQQARHWAEQALLTARSRPLDGLAVYDGCFAPAEVLSALAVEERSTPERRALITLAGRALIPAWHYATVFPIGRPRAALVTGMYARMRDQTWLARLFFQQALATANELSMPYESQRAQSALDNLTRN